jgi:hypothetical protein
MAEKGKIKVVWLKNETDIGVEQEIVISEELEKELILQKKWPDQITIGEAVYVCVTGHNEWGCYPLGD